MSDLTTDEIRARGKALMAAGLNKTEAADKLGITRRRLSDALNPIAHEARLEQHRSPSKGMTRVAGAKRR